jgi:prolyl oligopeptidase
LYIATNEKAPQYKVITIDLEDRTREHKDLIPEDPNAVLESVRAVHYDNFAIVYKRNVSTIVVY